MGPALLTRLRKRLMQSARALGKDNGAIFDEIYRKNHWGGEGIYSGVGSEESNSRPYEDLVVSYVEEHGIKSIVDVGCGDFQVSGRILDRLPDSLTYTGVDVSQVVRTATHALHVFHMDHENGEVMSLEHTGDGTLLTARVTEALAAELEEYALTHPA